MKITIDTHYCSREELAELKEYLEEKCWDYRTDEKEEEELATLKEYLEEKEETKLGEKQDREAGESSLAQ